MNSVPEPEVMPLDRVAWKQELHLSNFVNAYYQLRDVQSCGKVRSILVIGPGQGLDTEVFRWRGYQVTTLDIDATFSPDVIASCHDLSMFAAGQFDAVIASHVLEHLPPTYLATALREIARVGRFALVYLPVAGRHMQLRFNPAMLGLDLSIILDLAKYWEKPHESEPRYCQRQHYWEIGLRGYRKADLVRRFSQCFNVIQAYRNRDWSPSYNFVLRSKLQEASS